MSATKEMVQQVRNSMAQVGSRSRATRRDLAATTTWLRRLGGPRPPSQQPPRGT